MSNINQFFSGGWPLGAAVTMATQSDEVYNAEDGTQWYSNHSIAPFNYTSDYSNLPSHMLSPHPIMKGPETSTYFIPAITNFNIAYDKTANVIVTSSYVGGSGPGYQYYRTTNGGETWDNYYFPNKTLNYSTIQYTAGKFIAHVPSTTSGNVILLSTDGISWSNATTSASVPSQDIISDNGNTILIYGTGTAHTVSTNGGNTWALSTAPYTSVNGTLVGGGAVTYNQGANLFIAPTQTTGAYQTSAPGQAWSGNVTNGTYLFNGIRLGALPRMASNATITVVIGNTGFYMTTTDSVTWSNPGYICNNLTSVNPNNFYYDGTKWVARFSHRIFYSYNSVDWHETFAGGFTLILPQSNGLLFGFCLLSATSPTKCLRVANVADTISLTVTSPVLPTSISTTTIYYRIK